MSEKREAVFLISVVVLLFFTVSFIMALNDTEDSSSSSTAASTNSASTTNMSGFDKSYQCLKNQVDERGVSSLTTEELAFSLLALAYDSSMKTDLKSELDKRSSDGECWSSDSSDECKLKETSLTLLAYDHINKDTNKIEDWLLNQTKAPTELVWYLQIDSDKESECSIEYDNSSRDITINADKTISGSAGSCFKLAYNNYWLEIDSDCYEKTFYVSCNNDFLTALTYKKKTDLTYYISTTTHTAAANGETSEKVDSLCFKEGSSCNYEGSLWAALALQKTSHDISAFLPYLMALSSDNDRYFPSAFLYSLTGFDQYYTEIVNQQNTKGYWQMSDTSKRYYDTATGLLGLSGHDSESSDNAIDYLLDPSVQGNGCWNGNNIRDTAFILYAASPKAASSEGTPRSQCTDFSGYSCLSSTECEKINGTSLSNFYCFGGEICCNKKPVQKTCIEEGGTTCSSSEECTGTLVSGLNRCCKDGKCKPIQQQDTCTEAGIDFACKTQCLATEEIQSQYSCPENAKCCSPITEPPAKNYWWIWLLVILIILLVLAIIFRNQLKLWFFKTKNKFSKSPMAQQTRPFPPMPPSAQQGMMTGPRRILPQQRVGIRPQAGPRPMQRPFPKDRELDETLKKLKDMSK